MDLLSRALWLVGRVLCLLLSKDLDLLLSITRRQMFVLMVYLL